MTIHQFNMLCIEKELHWQSQLSRTILNLGVFHQLSILFLLKLRTRSMIEIFQSQKSKSTPKYSKA